MTSYKTLPVDEAAAAIEAVKGFEPLVVDGKLVAITAGDLRIYVTKDGLAISKRETDNG